MANLRGYDVLWDAASVDPGDDTTITSRIGLVGPGPWVAIYITSDQDAVFALQAGVNPTGISSGRNAYNDADPPDGGMLWFNYDPADENTLDLSAIAVASGTSIAIDLSPFAPALLRLVRTDSGTAATISAWMTSFGQN